MGNPQTTAETADHERISAGLQSLLINDSSASRTEVPSTLTTRADQQANTTALKVANKLKIKAELETFYSAVDQEVGAMSPEDLATVQYSKEGFKESTNRHIEFYIRLMFGVAWGLFDDEKETFLAEQAQKLLNETKASYVEFRKTILEEDEGIDSL